MNPKTLLEEYDIVPRKSLGQNFLHDPNMLDKIVSIAELTPNDLVLEVGPGTGLLTERIAKAAKQLISIEVDERLQPLLIHPAPKRGRGSSNASSAARPPMSSPAPACAT